LELAKIYEIYAVQGVKCGFFCLIHNLIGKDNHIYINRFLPWRMSHSGTGITQITFSVETLGTDMISQSNPLENIKNLQRLIAIRH
jgi:hypothetical protein